MEKQYEFNVAETLFEELGLTLGKLYVAKNINKNDHEYKTLSDSLKVIVDMLRDITIVSNIYLRKLNESTESLVREERELKILLKECKDIKQHRNWLQSYSKIFECYSKLQVIERVMKRRLSEILTDAANFNLRYLKGKVTMKDTEQIFITVYNRNKLNYIENISGQNTCVSEFIKRSALEIVRNDIEENTIIEAEKIVGKYHLINFLRIIALCNFKK